jgi:hypothetical protein
MDAKSNHPGGGRPRWRPLSFRSLPAQVELALQAEPESVYLGAARWFTEDELRSGALAHLGVSIGPDGEPDLPDGRVVPSTGPRATWNRNGRVISRTDLDKEEHTHSWDGYVYGEHPYTFSRSIWRYPQERRHGDRLEFELKLLLEEASVSASRVFLLGATMDQPLERSHQHFDKELLFRVSLMQEQFGAVTAFAEEPDEDDLVSQVFTGWKLLPPELRKVEIATALERSGSPGAQERFIERIDWIRQEAPGAQILTGSDGFGGYFLASISEACIVAEHVLPGNAIYVFGRDWEELSKQPRAWLRRNAASRIKRIEHDEAGNWRRTLEGIIRKHRP